MTHAAAVIVAWGLIGYALGGREDGWPLAFWLAVFMLLHQAG